MQPIISIVTPSLNQGKFIERTIQSVLTQGIDNLEYYVADGGSNDGSLEIIIKYGDRLRYVSEKDNGQAAGVNKGIKATSGDIIGWLNSDDIYYPGALSLVINYFAGDPEVDIVYGDANHIDENDNIIEPYNTEDWNYERLKEECFLCQPAVFFRRRLFEKAGLLDENLHYCMDYEYWLRLGKLTYFNRLPSVLAGSRMYKTNKTLGNRVSVHQEINDMLLQKMGTVPDKWIYAYAHAVVESKGFSRDTSLQNFIFVLVLIFTSIFTFFRWQRRLAFRAIRKMVSWYISSFKNTLKRNN